MGRRGVSVGMTLVCRRECRCEQDFWWVGTVVVEERFVLETDLDVAGVTICTWPELALV